MTAPRTSRRLAHDSRGRDGASRRVRAIAARLGFVRRVAARARRVLRDAVQPGTARWRCRSRYTSAATLGPTGRVGDGDSRSRRVRRDRRAALSAWHGRGQFESRAGNAVDDSSRSCCRRGALRGFVRVTRRAWLRRHGGRVRSARRVARRAARVTSTGRVYRLIGVAPARAAPRSSPRARARAACGKCQRRAVSWLGSRRDSSCTRAPSRVGQTAHRSGEHAVAARRS